MEGPHVPSWFEKGYGENYQSVLREELERIEKDPDAYLSSRTFDIDGERIWWDAAKERAGLTTEQIRELAHEAATLTLEGFDFQSLAEQEQRLLAAFTENHAALQREARAVVELLGKLVHVGVLRRMVRERLPHRRAVLHRGSTEELTPGAAKVAATLGPFGNLVKFTLKDTSFHIEEIRENLERGIGGFEFDVKAAENGDIVVSHAITKEAVTAAPTLDALLDMVREVLPQDPHEAREARRGLMLFVHVKTPTDDPAALEKVLRSLDAHGLTGQAVFQTGRPETIYILDEIETKLSQENPNRANARYAFQSLPIEAMGTAAQKAGAVLEKLGLVSRYSGEELRSLTSLVDEMPFLTEFPPRGRVREILQRRRGVLAVASALYSQELLAKAKEIGLGVHVGALSKGPIAEEILEPDSERGRPHSIMAMGKEALFPQAKKSS